MSFPCYPEYKDSGVEWLGAVPLHWDVVRFRYYFTESPEKIEKEVVGPMLSVSGYRGIEVKEYDDENRRRSDEDLVGYRIVRPGQLVVNTMWLNYAGLGVSEYEGHVSPAYRSYWIGPGLCRRFVHHLMRSETYVKGYKKYLTGIRPNSLQMSRDDLMAFPVLVPPAAEQEAIAKFVDAEVAKIDALIFEQEKLIALLKEKRQAVISEAVTKGLDSSVQMKDSCIEWLGVVPQHWEIRKVSNFFRARKGANAATLTKEYCATIAGDHPVYSGQTENDGVMACIDCYEFDAGESGFLFSTTVGAKAMTLMHVKGRFSLSQNCMVIQPTSALVEAGFYFYHMQPLFNYERGLIPEHMQASFRMEDLYAYRIALPSLEEQLGIARWLDAKCTKFDELASEAQLTVELLAERRAALIAAAVTGKIDVGQLSFAEAE